MKILTLSNDSIVAPDQLRFNISGNYTLNMPKLGQHRILVWVTDDNSSAIDKYNDDRDNGLMNNALLVGANVPDFDPAGANDATLILESLIALGDDTGGQSGFDFTDAVVSDDGRPDGQ